MTFNLPCTVPHHLSSVNIACSTNCSTLRLLNSTVQQSLHGQRESMQSTDLAIEVL